mgnify:CR=1 FL=1
MIISRLPRLVIAFCMALLVVGTIGVTTQKASAAQAKDGGNNTVEANAKDCKSTFFGLKPWYYYMDQEFTGSRTNANEASPCDFKCFNIFNQTVANECGKTSSDLPALLLVIIDDLLRVAGLVAVAFVFVGAFQYTTSSGNPEQTAKARSTLINAFGGLAVALVSVAFVTFIGSRIN